MENNSKLTFFANNQLVEVKVVRTTNKNMYLRIVDEEIVVSAPKKMNENDMKDFVQANIERFAKYQSKKKALVYYSVSEQFFYLFGKKYTFVLFKGFPKSSIVLRQRQYYLQCNEGDSSEIESAIISYISKELLAYLITSVTNTEKIMGLPPHSIRVSNKESSWATNLLDKNQINFARKLAFYNKTIIDYVVIHELAHDTHPDHSTNFWAFVEKYCPGYKKLRQSLRADQEITEE